MKESRACLGCEIFCDLKSCEPRERRKLALFRRRREILQMSEVARPNLVVTVSRCVCLILAMCAMLCLPAAAGAAWSKFRDGNLVGSPRLADELAG